MQKKIKDLKDEEITYCIELLLKIGTPSHEIERFISMSETKENNLIALYIKLYNKLKFYEEKLGIKEILNYIDECMKEMVICDEYYTLYKSEIEEKIEKVIGLLPQNYEYEIKEIEKRMKLEK